MAAVKEATLRWREDLTAALLYFTLQQRRRRRRRRWYVCPGNRNRRSNGEFALNIRQMRSTDGEAHRSYFRMGPARFDDLLRRVAPFIKHARTHKNPISTEERLALTLRTLGCGASQQSVSESFRMGSSTACRIVEEVSRALWRALQAEYVTLPTGGQWEHISQDFWRLWGFPNCVGAIDAKQVLMRAPARSPHSIVLLAMCDARYRFTMVDVGAYDPGSEHVFQESAFGRALLEGKLDLPLPAPLPGTTTVGPYVILGDAEFPLSVNLMRPYPGDDLPTDESLYNSRHGRAERTIETCFDILCERFRILGRPLQSSVDKAVCIVKACVALHNYLVCTDAAAGDAAAGEAARYITPNLLGSTVGEVQPGEWTRPIEVDNLVDPGRLSGTRAPQDAILTRDVLKEFFQTPLGHISV